MAVDTSSISILIIGNYRQTLMVVRSLDGRGYRLIVGNDGDTARVEHSRHVAEVWNHPPAGADKAAFLAALEALLSRRRDIAFLYPVGEDEMLAVSDAYTRLSARAGILMPVPDVVRTCLDKSLMLGVADGLDIPQAPHATVSSLDGLHAAAGRIGFPLVVKPTDSGFRLLGRKAVICRHSDDMESAFSTWPVDGRRLIVQRHAGGVRHNVYFFAVDGKLVQASQVRILRTDKPDDTGLAVSGVTVPLDPELDGYCRRLLEHLAYTGAGCIQFLVDGENGHVSFLELNPRLGANSAVVYRAGLDLPAMAFGLAQGCFDAAAAEYRRSCRTGVHYAWTQGELLALKKAIANRDLGPLEVLARLLVVARTFVTSSVHITWSWKDPLPTLLLYLDLLNLSGRQKARRAGEGAKTERPR